ncbi:hypothetical protein AJ88_13895 [Mesorhizobium amorphae CCBAU 01583]|nr:hypothetical protein AJ88_13895 [Mesorhizobium amorphae CCBAU 01583]
MLLGEQGRIVGFILRLRLRDCEAVFALPIYLSHHQVKYVWVNIVKASQLAHQGHGVTTPTIFGDSLFADGFFEGATKNIEIERRYPALWMVFCHFGLHVKRREHLSPPPSTAHGGIRSSATQVATLPGGHYER